MNADQLMQVYPQLDYLMAETLLQMSAQGKLQEYVDAVPPPAHTSQRVEGAITVENKIDA